MIRNVLGEIRRIPGVGRATLFSTERSLRVWIDADKLVGYQLTSDDVTKAIEAQNAQVASGSLGAEPSRKSQPISALVLVKGQLTTPEEFGAIVLRANPDGSTVRLRDVARIEVGGMGYQFTTRLNGRPSAGLSVLLAPTGNALATANAVQAKMEELSKFFPSNIKYEIPYDITPVVEASIKKVIVTLIEAVILVFLVMLLFLQNIRYTLIPTVVVPVALLGTCATLLLMGLSINMLTLFAMVLAIGILVDDAIVVVENVERIMSEEGLPPREATRKAMQQITGAIIGITLVLVAVFIPMAFFPGSVGVIYRQFSVTMVSAIAFSAFLALSLTPALCATLLKPVAAGHHHARRGLFGLFNRGMDKTKAGYSGVVRWTLLRTGRLMLIYLAIVIALGWAFMRLPAGFLPVDDQGFITADVQTPPEASFNRTLDAVKRVEEFLAQRKGVDNVTFLTGFSFLGQGQNTAQAFVTLKDWSERGPNDSAEAIVADINKSLATSVRDAKISALQPPPIDNLGNSSGFSFRLQDRAQKGYAELMGAKDQLLIAAKKSPILQDVYVEGLAPAPQVELVVDREKAAALGVTFQDVNSTISTNLGSSYINDFPNRGRMQRVIVQADNSGRMQTDDILTFNVRNSKGNLVPLSSFATIRWIVGPTQMVGFNYYPAVRISGSAKPGYTSGDAIAEMERIAGRTAARVRLRMDRSVGAGEARGLAGPAAPRAFRAGGVPAACGPVRELDDSDLGSSGGSARHARRRRRRDAARHAERRLFHHRAGHHHRSRRQGCDPDHRIRQGPARAGQAPDRGRGRGRPSALPADPHDRFRVRVRRGPDGDRVGCQRQEPAGARHRRHGRHDRRGRAGPAHGAGVLRRGAEAVYATRKG